MSAPVNRVGGRVLVIDPAWRVLLIHEHITEGTHWLTPGGGVEPGETPCEAAIRELAEETGIEVSIAPDAEPVLVTRREWHWGDLTFDQVDHFFIAHVAAGLATVPTALTELEARTVIGDRWWTVDELRRTDEALEPPEIADLLERLRRADSPATAGG